MHSHHQRIRSRKPKVRPEGEHLSAKMEGSTSQEQIKPNRAPPTRIPQDINDEEQPNEPEQTKEDIQIVSLLNVTDVRNH